MKYQPLNIHERMNRLTYLVNCNAYIRSSEYEVLKSTSNHLNCVGFEKGMLVDLDKEEPTTIGVVIGIIIFKPGPVKGPGSGF